VAAPRDEVKRQQSIGRIVLAEARRRRSLGNFSQLPAHQLRGLREPDALRRRPRRPVRLDAWLLGEEARASLLVAALSDDVIKIILDSCKLQAGVRPQAAWRLSSSSRVCAPLPSLRGVNHSRDSRKFHRSCAILRA